MSIPKCLVFFPLILAGMEFSSAQTFEKTQPEVVPLEEDYDAGRIISRREVEDRTESALLIPIRIFGYPFRLVNRGIEKGLVSFEENRMREKLYYWQERLGEKGITPLFGGLGEGTGLGGGMIYHPRLTRGGEIQLLGNATLRGYQEFGVSWAREGGKSALRAAGSYQWRPQENFYGLGHESRLEDHTQFALRQSWTGLDAYYFPHRRIGVGTGYKWIRLKAVNPSRSRFPSADELFPDLVGFNTPIRMHQAGVFVDADFLQGEYQWGGEAYLEASYQREIGGELEYWIYRADLEGRMPVARDQSALVGVAGLELNRESSGSGPLPFFLNAHVGGSATMRGFALDRYYGRNLLFASLEYRFSLSPDLQASVFFDEGQIFNETSDLALLNWHRNYGIGVKFKAGPASVLGMELGYGEDGLNFHLTLGDRIAGPLGGPIRYGRYRR